MEEFPMSKSIAALASFALLASHSLAVAQTRSPETNTPPSQAADSPPPPAIIGTIDMKLVFDGYEKIKFALEQLKAEGLAKQGQLNTITGEMASIKKQAETFAPGSADYKRLEDKMSELKVRYQTEGEKAEREIDQRYAEILNTFHKEVQSMVGLVAQRKGLTFVVQIANPPANAASNPDAIMASMGRTVVYADPSVDITNWVLHNLNKRYLEAGGKTVAASTTLDPNARPASTAPTRPATPPANSPQPTTTPNTAPTQRPR
jgi:Skp family chaperone for outer membrane proteins